MKFADKIVLLIVLFSILDSFESAPQGSVISRLQNKRPSVRRFMPKSAGFQSVLEQINSVLMAQRRHIKYLKKTPIFKQGSVYKFQVEMIEHLKRSKCHARINLGKLHVFDCWS
jgi:hypothetical protein